jgi:hypothetical protein
MTFLELCQMTARQTGTIQSPPAGTALPTTVVGQVHRLQQIVEFVREAYIDIQNAHRMWRWLNSEFYGVTIPYVPITSTAFVPGTTKYAGTDFFDERSNTRITRFSQWGFKGDGSDIGLSICPATRFAFTDGHGSMVAGDEGYVASTASAAFSSVMILLVQHEGGSWTGPTYASGHMVVRQLTGRIEVPATMSVEFSNFAAVPSVTGEDELGEGPLRWLDWERFYETQLRGPTAPGKPQFYSVTPDNELIISPQPDAHYFLRGKYRKSMQSLALDADTPEMPSEFHTIIKDAALQYVEGMDEGPRIPIVRLRMLPNFSMLEAHQLPKVSWGAPLA